MRRPALVITDRDVDRRVEQQRGRGGALRGDGREIGERLERRAGLPPHGLRPVEGREVVVTATHQRANAAAARIDREDGHLQRLAAGLRGDPVVARLELLRRAARGALGRVLGGGVDLADDGETAFEYGPQADLIHDLGAQRPEVERIGRLRD